MSGHAAPPVFINMPTVQEYGRRAGFFGGALGMLFFSVLAGVLVAALTVPAILVTSRVSNASIGYFRALPDYITLGQQPQRNTIFANRDGQPVHIATIYDQDRQEVGWDAVSQFLKDATIAGEDRRFYEHGGIDPQSIVRAVVGNVAENDITSGSSTISMQLVKNLLIQRSLQIADPKEKKAVFDSAVENTLNRKLREMKLAIGLEKRYTKNEILLGYLNIAGFGGTTYGVEAAAQEYFSVSAKDVTLAQAASLIAMVQQPNLRNLSKPELYPANKERRDLILNDMHELKYITKAQLDEAIATPIQPKLQGPTNGCLYAKDAKFACDYALKLVPTLEALGANAGERAATWARGGYQIYLSIDLGQQAVAQANLSASAPATENRFALGAAAVSVQPGTGRILIMAQNKDYNNSAAGGGPTATAVNYSTDRALGGSAGFATGSTYKIFTLTEWLQSRHKLSEVVDATKRPFPMTSFKAPSCGKAFSGPPYTPKNDSPREGGKMTVAAATQGSVNVAFMSMAQRLDLCKIRSTAMAMGAHRADGAELDAYPSATLGTNEIAPLTMAGAIATIGANGVYCAPTIIDKIVLPDGTESPGQAKECSQAVAPNVASTVAYALSAVMRAGTGRPGNPQDGVPVIGKTGTTDAAEQNWLVATTTKVALAVWAGNTDGGHRNFRRTTIAGTNGYNTKFIIFKATLQSLNGNPEYRGGAFPAPDPSLVNGSSPAKKR